MCGRYASFREAQDLADEFAVARIADDVRLLPPSWNVAPTDTVRMVVERPSRLEDGSAGEIERTLRGARWGLVPSWAKDPKIGSTMINARAETLATKPAFRRAFATRRALLPADGYYEWQPPAPGSPTKTKQPIYIHAPDDVPLAMAGLYEFWADPTKEPDDPTRWLVTATVVTTTAVDEMGQVHDRQPVILLPDRWDAWLDPAVDAAGAASLLAAPAPRLALTPVSTAVNKVSNNSPTLITPL
ncbi:SOS response-associated peptidase [Pengzhenrongella frigida]|uniref:Abasic site processing protein n=1 Tax=Pengzhenrongella frigida TaxID=1259133 RepID=A0A4Q5N1R2_9MICO|nr:SOS response-associated peptidase [Cellulomonas sp. HLT2-17]RYV52029.1 SOS response-associated peptidase [Cellulomonas sp. HLT2-17]